MVELPAQHEASTSKLEERYRAIRDKIRAQHEASWQAMAAAWRDGMARARGSIDAVAREVDAYAPRWDDPSWADRPPSRAIPPLLRIGETRVDLASLPGGVSSDPTLMEGIATRFDFPALLPFPDRANLLIEGPAEARSASLGVLQAAMFRLLASLPPGQVRFTIVDPIGIGRNFGAFMHLADFDEALVGGQVLTDPKQVDERLAELSAHMEKVTQKYLRDEYATIDDYNAVAGEVAEPYRVLVVADFPVGFEEKTAARLAAITAGGTPCGVITLVARDVDRPLPFGVTAESLRANATPLIWDGHRLDWADADFRRHPLILDAPPAGEAATRLIQRLGAASRDAKRVEVPFDFIAPAEADWWKLDSRGGIDLPLGKAGATKRQHLTLGKGTSQHVLVAGRTGSGKSTLLHALIVNLALNYGPDEVELYLIDFKKGVEFKVYATYNLPHAGVIAIESEREFGISVLPAARWRAAEPRRPVPRRGRAGPQRLPERAQHPALPEDPADRRRVPGVLRRGGQARPGGGAAARPPGPARAGVRRPRPPRLAVARRGVCPGPDHAGADGGPDRLAVLRVRRAPDPQRAERGRQAPLPPRRGDLQRRQRVGRGEPLLPGRLALRREARGLPGEAPRPGHRAQADLDTRVPIVFEGDAQAELSRNPLLRPLIESPTWPKSPRSSQAWLGDPIAIKDPTAVLFRRQGGNHLLIVGQKPEAALGVVAATLIGLAAQYPPAKSATVRDGAKFYLLDGTPEDDPRAEALANLATKLAGHSIEVVGWRDAPRVVAEVGEEVARRQQPGADDGPELFLFVHDLGRFRDLRRKENDFGFGSPGEPLIPADHLAAILKEGSALGVHLVAWSDTLVNLNRVFENQAIREFESRVLFQISPTDSAHLLDSPAASKLGPNRALFASEEQNRLEKFRPYGLPSDEWLAKLKEKFEARAMG